MVTVWPGASGPLVLAHRQRGRRKLR
jgi:hypothetical protein